MAAASGRKQLMAFLLVAALAVAAGLAACSGRDDALMAAGVPAEPAVLLAADDPAGFRAWAAAGSADRLLELRASLLDALYAPELPGGAESTALAQALARVDATLGEVCGLPGYAAASASLASLHPDSAAAGRRRRRTMQAIFADPDLGAAEKRDRITRLQDLLLGAGHWQAAAEGWYDLAVLMREQRATAEWDSLLRSSASLSLKHDLLPDYCLAWGQLKMAALFRGWTPAERDSIRVLIDRSRRARLARVSTYLLSLQAYDALNRGRYPTARALFEDGIEICRTLGDPALALPTIDVLLRVYGVLECWDQVDLMLTRARSLGDEADAGRGLAAGRALSDVRRTGLMARSLAARGRLDEAQARFADAYSGALRLPYGEDQYQGQEWVRTMMTCDRPDLAGEALAAILAGGGIDERAPVGMHLALWQAWLAWRAGDTARAEQQLDVFAERAALHRPETVGNLDLQRDALAARIAAPADPGRAAALLGDAWCRLDVRLGSREKGPESYLDLSRNGVLRTAAHELLGAEPATGYGLELLWRRMLLDWRTGDCLAAEGGLPRAAARLADEAQAALRRNDGLHCLYQVRRDSVVRWTADGATIGRATLAASTDSLRGLVAGVLERLGRDPGDLEAAPPADLVRDLGVLARAILPDAMFDAARRPPRLFVSGDGFLSQIPFSPLNLDEGGAFLPLVTQVDVAWVRGGPTPGARAWRDVASAPAVVVADPALDPATRRRFSLPDGLPGAAAERDQVAGMLQSAVVLAEADATVPAVTAACGAAGVVYVVGHAVRDAEVPFSTWLPLAPAGADETYAGLDMQDVLAAGLGGCALVVLSGCATGAPYVDGLMAAPSLGDVFLDAGAGAVIQTFWRVRDDGSAVHPERILAAWQGGADLAAAVSAERRRALIGPKGARHPFDWAAWTVKSAWF